jgi:hypothetical protein
MPQAGRQQGSFFFARFVEVVVGRRTLLVFFLVVLRMIRESCVSTVLHSQHFLLFNFFSLCSKDRVPTFFGVFSFRFFLLFRCCASSSSKGLSGCCCGCLCVVDSIRFDSFLHSSWDGYDPSSGAVCVHFLLQPATV